ncbi:TcaA 3rd/4th domain-containing protein [[Bacillus] enclensis]|uniref:TcaA 3rd/4th domain-containing protein n=1 Tax=[Bacillus] enclensis TaxID=1402860 RepID=UPI003AF8CD95
MGYFYIKDQSSPESTIDSFIKSMKDGDARTLSDEVHNAVTGMYVNESEMKKLLNDLQKSPETMEAIIKSLKEQEKEFSNNKSSNTKRKSIIFALFKSPEKKWNVIDQYSIQLNSIDLTIQAESGAEISINQKEIPLSESGLYEVKNLLPGTFILKATKKENHGTLESSKTLTLWETPEEPVTLFFKNEYITVSSNLTGAELYLNGKPHGTLTEKQTEIRIGPIGEDNTATIISGKYSYPWGDVWSEEITAKGDEKVELTFQVDKQAILDDLREDIIHYNQSYIEAITYTDSSLLKNTGGVLLQENKNIIENLKQRNVTYGGEMEDMIFDKESFVFDEENDVYKASINVEERYASSWNDPADPDAAIFKPKRYYYTYDCEYDNQSGKWIVIDSTEHDFLSITEPF